MTGRGPRGAWADALLLAAPLAACWLGFAGLGAYPFNDDFMFARCVERWLSAGRPDWQVLDQQLPLGAPQAAAGMAACRLTGFSFRTLHAVSAAFLWLGAAGLLLALRQAGAAGPALLVAMTAVVAPVSFQHAFTFMSDGPAAALLLLAGAALAAGFAQYDRRWMFLGGGAGLLAVLSRQTAAALVLAPLAMAFVSGGGNRPRLTLAACGIGLPLLGLALIEAGCFGPGSAVRAATIAAVDPGGRNAWATLYGACLFLGLHTLPLAPLLCRRPRGPAGWCGAALGAAPLLLFLLRPGATLVNAGGPCLRNAGFGPALLAGAYDRPSFDGAEWPAGIWQGITLLAACQCVLLGAEAGRTVAECRRRPERFGLLAAAAGSLFGQWLFLQVHFDRYWLAPLALAVAWLGFGAVPPREPVTEAVVAAGPASARGDRRRLAVGVALAAALLAADVVFLHDMLARNHARWSLIAQAERQGAAPERIDGGYEHWGWTRSAAGMVRMPPPLPAGLGPRRTWWDDGSATFIVSAANRGGWQVVAEWPAWAVGGARQRLILELPPP